MSGLINETLLTTKIKIFAARIPYIITTLFYGKKPRIITREGIKYEVDLSEGIDLSIFIFGKYQEHVTKNKLLKLPKDSVFIDVGANMGVMSLKFAQLAPEGKVYSFEPTHYSMARLRRNLEINPQLASRVEVVNSFVSSKTSANTNLKAYASWKVNGTREEGAHPVHLGIAKSTEGVGAISLDDFCQSKNLAKITLIKIDTDGHEYDVLLGARETIKKYKPQIIFEAGIYAMTENTIDFSFYVNYFNELEYSLFDSIKGVELATNNYLKYIPQKGTIDIIALPTGQNKAS